MYVNGIQCDICTKIYNQKVHDFDDVPKSWFFVREGKKFKDDGNVAYMHFCSLHCLHEWVEKQIPVVGEVFPSFRNSETEEEKQEDINYWRDN